MDVATITRLMTLAGLVAVMLATGLRVQLAEVVEEVRERDKRDTDRKVSPLVRAADAVLVDNTAMDVEETARLIIMLAGEREKESSKSAGGRS